MMDAGKIARALDRAGEIRVAVFGDYCLDKYLYMDPKRDELSVETGLMAWQIHEKRLFPGAGGTVASNLRSLGVQVICIGLMGDDGEGYDLRKALEKIGADSSLMVVSDEICTGTYTKPMRLQEDGSWERDFEIHKERAYTVEELTAWLEAAGFGEIRTYGDMKMRRPAEGEQRIYFSCIRE